MIQFDTATVLFDIKGEKKKKMSGLHQQNLKKPI
jgi:hypothetical protein